MRMFGTSPVCLLYVSFSLLSFYAVAISIPSNPTIPTTLNASSFPDFSTEMKNLGAIDPSKFSLVMKAGNDNLAPTATLMNAVDTMVQLALMDFEGQMPQTTFRLDVAKYSQVEILIGPISTAAGATMPPAFAIFGLHKIMLYILTDPTRRFKSVHCYLSYENREVGTLEIRKRPRSSPASPPNEKVDTPSHSLTISNATHLLNSTADPSTQLDNTTMLTAPAWQDPHLALSIVQALDTFTIYEVFFFVLSLLQEFSPIERTTRVLDFSTVLKAPPITTANQPIAISFKNHDSPPRTAANPPYFQIEWLIKAFGQLPAYMIDRANFHEVVAMGLKVDGVEVGEGYIVRQRTGVEDLADVS